MPIFRNPNLPDPNDPSQQPDAAVDTTPAPMRYVPLKPVSVTSKKITSPTARPTGGLLATLFGGGQGSQSSPSGGLGSFLGGDTSYVGGMDDDWRSRLNKLGAVMMMLDPMSRDAGVAMLNMEQNRAQTRYTLGQQNQTVQWLMSQGLSQGEATTLARDPAMLKEWYQNQKLPKWEIHEVYDAQHRKQQIRVDLNSGRYQALGSDAPPNMELGEVYDENGMPQKVLINKDDPTAHPIAVGGPKTDMYTPGAYQQHLGIAAAGRMQPPAAGETENQKAIGKWLGDQLTSTLQLGADAPEKLGLLNQMENFVNSKGFKSGGGKEGSDWLLKIGQWAKGLGFDQQGLAGEEAFQMLSNELVHKDIGKLGAGISDADRDYVQGMNPNLGVSKPGNLAMILLRRRAFEQHQKVAEFAQQYAASHGGTLDIGYTIALHQWAKDHPMLSEADKARLTQLSNDDAATPKTMPEGKPGETVPAGGNSNLRVTITPAGGG